MHAGDIAALSQRIESCDLPCVLDRTETMAAVHHFDALADHERSRAAGDMRWLTVKVKLAADQHQIPMDIPAGMVEYYEGFVKDHELSRMSGLLQLAASWAKRLGFRPSFYRAVS